jgi:hypothetical protein
MVAKRRSPSAAGTIDLHCIQLRYYGERRRRG